MVSCNPDNFASVNRRDVNPTSTKIEVESGAPATTQPHFGADVHRPLNTRQMNEWYGFVLSVDKIFPPKYAHSLLGLRNMLAGDKTNLFFRAASERAYSK